MATDTAIDVVMPQMGVSISEGTVTRWLKQEGDRVEADEPLLEVSTDKVDTEIPAPASGVLERIVVREDETAEVGSELAVIGDGGSGDGSAPASTGTEAPAAAASEAAASEAAASEAAASEAPAEEPARQDERPEPVQPTTAPPEAAEPEASSPQQGGTTSVTMPALGESVTEGTVTRWLKQVGEEVQADEPLLEVSTDKVDTEIPAPASGTLLEIKVPEDETAAVGAELAVIGSGAAAPQAAPEAAPEQPQARPEPEPEPETRPEPEPEARPEPQPEARPEPQREPEPAAPPQARQVEPAPAPANGEDFGGYVTPLVRKLASEQRVDLSTVRGTGVGGRIRKQDVLDAAVQRRADEAARQKAEQPAAQPAKAPAAQPSPLRGRTEKLSRLRSIIAKRMVESLQTAAQLTTVVEVDVTRIARLRDRAKADFQRLHGVKLTFLPFFALATVEALRVHRSVNASIDVEAGTVTYFDAEHLGIAVDTEKGLMVPVIRNAGDLNLAGLAKRIADLAERTRTMKIEPDELSGGTFTLTNTGSRGALFDTPIINQPQVGILGTGAVVKRAVVVDDPDLGEIILPRSMMYLALTYDHRLVDGADAARFLGTVKDRLESGGFEAEVGLA